MVNTIVNYYLTRNGDAPQCHELHDDNRRPAEGVCQHDEEEPEDDLDVADAADGRRVTCAVDADEHQGVEECNQHQTTETKF